MREATRRGFVIGGAAVLAACATAPAPARFAEITFAHEPPFVLDVARVEFVEQFVAPLEPPHVESEFPIPPADGARRWAQDRLRTAGLNRTARAILLDASAVERGLATQGGVTGFFTSDQEKRYDVTVAMRIEIVADDGRYVEAHVQASANGSATVAEDATLEERDRTLYRLTEQVMRALDGELDAGIRKHLAAYIR